jgi:hypothetical protein
MTSNGSSTSSGAGWRRKVWRSTRPPGDATGFDGALAAIAAARPWGPALLAAVAVGLFSYAAYSLVEGHHRRLRH